VDAEAHRGALAAGGATVAVLGCGLDRDYPAGHAELARRIARTGLIVSEYAPGVPPAPWQFPARNRIIAGLSQVVVVVEARERSGALITADFALEEGREVFAVPGPITSSLSTGTNGLLRAGAGPLLCAEDALEALGLEAGEAGTAVSPAQAWILAALEEGALDVDALVEQTGLAAGEIGGLLVELELAGHVASDDGILRSIASKRASSTAAGPEAVGRTGRGASGPAAARPPPPPFPRVRASEPPAGSGAAPLV
jgi:DNA processing protein